MPAQIGSLHLYLQEDMTFAPKAIQITQNWNFDTIRRNVKFHDWQGSINKKIYMYIYNPRKKELEPTRPDAGKLQANQT